MKLWVVGSMFEIMLFTVSDKSTFFTVRERLITQVAAMG
jgi:hypothetical protein